MLVEHLFDHLNGSEEEYRLQHRQLVDHYEQFWGVPNGSQKEVSKIELAKRLHWISETYGKLAVKWPEAGLGEIADLELYIGQGLSNGHAYKHSDGFRAFLCLESLKTKLQSEVFAAHELVHAAHYALQPRFYFQNEVQKENVARLFITEGIATWLSMELTGVSLGEALWADHLESSRLQRWLAECARNGGEIKELLRTNWRGTCPGLFQMEDPKDILKNRAGYWLAVRCTAELVEKEKLSMAELLAYPAEEINRAYQAML